MNNNFKTIEINRCIHKTVTNETGNYMIIKCITCISWILCNTIYLVFNNYYHVAGELLQLSIKNVKEIYGFGVYEDIQCGYVLTKLIIIFVELFENAIWVVHCSY